MWKNYAITKFYSLKFAMLRFRNDHKIISEIEKADEIFTSTLCAYEVYLGEAYSRLKGIRPKEKVTEFFDNMMIIDFTLDDARKSSEIKALLRTKVEEVNVLDILIAASAYRLELTIITKDHDCFLPNFCLPFC